MFYIVYDVIEGMQFFYSEMFVHCGTWWWCMIWVVSAELWCIKIKIEIIWNWDFVQWRPESVWEILATNGWEEHDHNPWVAVNELFFWCDQHLLVFGGRVCKWSGEVAHSGWKCCHRRETHCGWHRFFSAFSGCSICSLPYWCTRTNQCCLCLTLLLSELTFSYTIFYISV